MDATKESIMAVAMRLFAEKGLKLVTVREICKAADVNVALVNYYFRNKNGLYQACVERLFHENTGDELCTLGAVAEVTRSVQQVQIVCSEKRRSTIVYANNAPGHGMGEVVDRALARAKEELPRGYSAASSCRRSYRSTSYRPSAPAFVRAVDRWCHV